ncbi:MAG: FAD-dependent oxidoreductase [Sphingomonadales bacterium]
MSEIRDSRINRRQILAGAGVAAGAAAAIAVTGQAASAEPKAAWDREADIVVVGGGSAACSAAVTAASLGDKVVLLEKEAILGGTTNKSGGVAWVPNNPLMRKAGMTDARADCLGYMARFSFPQQFSPDSPTLGLDALTYRQLEAFYDNGSATIELLDKLGAAKYATFTVGGNPSPDYADHLPQNKAPKGRSLTPVNDKGEATTGDIGDGTVLIGAMEAWLTRNNVPLLTEHRVTAVVKENGRVVGVEAETGGKTVRIKARKGVIFGTGGYSHNTDLVALHQKALYGACAMPGSTGDFIAIAGAAGAKMGTLGTAWRTQVVFEEALQNRVLPQGVFFIPADAMFVVNKYGRRVVNEKRNYNDRTEVHFVYDPVAEDYPNQLLFMVFDGRVVDAFGGAYPIPAPGNLGPYVIEAADLPSLAAAIGKRLDGLKDKTGGVTLAGDFPAALQATFEKFNGYAKSGKDPDFKRGDQSYDREWQAFFSKMRDGSTEKPNAMPNSTLHPLRDKGPYYCIILAAGALDTSGGPQINEKAQVLGAGGEPIPGLYGAGNCIASPSREAYYGAGGTIGLCLTFGYIAAQTAHKETPAG